MADKPRVILAHIDTSPEREYIEIDGNEYGLITGSELSLKDLLILQRAQTKLAAGLDDESDEGVAQLADMLDKLTRIILLDCPEEVHERLRDFHRMEIIRSFTAAGGLAQASPTSTSEATTEESPDLPVSTEEELVTG